jgi:hypothetical protein
MHTFSDVIDPEGSVVDIVVGLAASDMLVLRRPGRPVPTPVTGRALIDTGADVSCAKPSMLIIILQSGVRPNRFLYTNVLAAGGVSLNPEYSVTLTSIHPSGNTRANLLLRDHPMLQQDLGVVGYQALLGRDVLAHCVFIHNGPSNRYLLGF